MTPPVASVLLEIADAFADQPYPGDANILRVSPPSPEYDEYLHLLRGPRWQDVPFENLSKIGAEISLLTDAGFQYYLPAFLTYSLIDYERSDTIPGYLFDLLTPPDESDLKQLRELGLWLEGPEAPPGLAADALQTALTAASGNQNELEQFQAHVAGFTPRQRHAIRTALEYMQAMYGDDYLYRGPKHALERYWDRF